MPWGRIDDRFYDHDKTSPETMGGLRLPALGLHLLALSWCNAKLTDGFVPAARPRKLTDLDADETDALVGTLLRAGLWEEADGGYAIHDFLVYNNSREQVMARQEQARQAGALGGAARAEQRKRTDPPSDEPSGSPSVRPSGSPTHPPSGPPSQRGRARERDPDPTNVPSPESERPTRSSPSVDLSSEHIPRAEVTRTAAQPRGRNGAAPGPRSSAVGTGNPVGETTMTERQHASWADYSAPEWGAFRAAWIGRGLKLAPSGAKDDEASQRAALWAIAEERPVALARWVQEAPAGAKAAEVVGYVLARAKRDEQVRTQQERGPDRSEAKAVLDEERTADDQWAEFG